jgi:hypothetical protein
VFAWLSTPAAVVADCAVATPCGGLGGVVGLALPGDLGHERVVRLHGSSLFSSRADVFVSPHPSSAEQRCRTRGSQA